MTLKGGLSAREEPTLVVQAMEHSDMSDASPRRRRGGGRAGNTRRDGNAIDQIDWHIPEISDAPTEPLRPEGVEAIHNAAMRILEEIGIDETIIAFRNPYEATPDTASLDEKIAQIHWYAENIIEPSRA